MKEKLLILISAFLVTLSLVLAACSPSAPEEPTPIATESPTPSLGANASPLVWLLHAVPAAADMIMFSDIPALSTYEGQAIPSRQASMQEKMEWWSTFQRYALGGIPYNGLPELWGFDGVDAQGLLTFWPMKVDGDTVNLIIMSGQSGDDPLRAKANIEAVLKAYHDKTTLAYGSGGITALADSLGKVGSAFITTRSDLEETWQRMDAAQKDNLKTAIGPGELDPYNEFAITYRKEGDSPLLEFVLAYDSAAAAEANTETLRVRLSEARSVGYHAPLTDLWTVRYVTAEGRFLRATVELIPQENGNTIYLAGMIYLPDYWFLLPRLANE